MIFHARNGSVPAGDSKMSYVSFGRGSQNLVLLPGLSDGLTTVRGKALMLAAPYRTFFRDFTVYVFSRRDKLPEDHSIRDMADDQAEAMQALGIGKACVMGVSEGGMIAQYLAADHPDLVEKLILAVTAPSANETVRACLAHWMSRAEAGDHKALMIDTAEKSYSQGYLKKYRKLYPLLGHVGKPSSYDRFLTNARAILHFDARDDLYRVLCPTLIIGGEDDRIVGVQASHQLHEQIAGSELYVYPGLGHAAYEEAKDFNERVKEFAERPAT